MSGRPKVETQRTWVELSPPKKRNGDRLRWPSPPDGDEPEERKANIKLAWFFVVVALLFVLAEHFGRVQERTDANLSLDSTPLVSLTISPPDRSGNRAGFSVRFRLSNRGNHSVFYPMDTTTSLPVEQLAARTSPPSDWVSLSSISKQRILAVQEFMDSNLTWIEMPPGGWVDGEFRDAGEFLEEHAYVIYVKPVRDAKGIRIVSKSYPSLSN
jgi:hypothetical protein